jgi:hypothetical protein
MGAGRTQEEGQREQEGQLGQRGPSGAVCLDGAAWEVDLVPVPTSMREDPSARLAAAR